MQYNRIVNCKHILYLQISIDTLGDTIMRIKEFKTTDEVNTTHKNKDYTL